jgi:hypothetical protein
MLSSSSRPDETAKDIFRNSMAALIGGHPVLFSVSVAASAPGCAAEQRFSYTAIEFLECSTIGPDAAKDRF